MNKKIDSIQMLRAFAVILVIYNHSMIICTDNKYNDSAQIDYYYLKHWTAIGLDLFFVISGLIMTIITTSYLKKQDGWLNFFFKRIIRIVPLYWLLSIIVFIERYILQHPVSKGEITKTIVFFPFFDAKDEVFPIIGQGWSLTYEMYFYLLIAVFLSFKPTHIFIKLLIVLIILSGIGYFFNPTDVLLKFITTPILAEFAMGVAVGLAYNFIVKHYQQIDIRYIKTLSCFATVTGLIFMLANVYFDSNTISNPQLIITDNDIAMSRVLLWGLPCCLFLLGVLFIEMAFTPAIPQILVKIGDASFSGYLIHILVIVTVGKMFNLLGFRSGDAFIIISTLAATAFSLPLYYYLEKPLIALGNKFAFKMRGSLKNSRVLS